MSMPKYFDLVRLSTQISDLIGYLIGLFTILSGLPAPGIGLRSLESSIAS